tara:strand:- start:21039 stop:22016 length:978 start_codon:yes stop_codon:yes gene_type:complete
MPFKIYNAKTLDDAVADLKSGKVIAFPTETVYGMGADASNVNAVQKVYEVKSRPISSPLIVHIDNPDKAKLLAKNIPSHYWVLAQAFWPGPLTIVLDKSEIVPDIITSGHSTVALRVPFNKLALSCLQHFDQGLVGPSANPFGKISPTCADHVFESFEQKIDGVIDGGISNVGIESTILHLTDNTAKILRHGLITPSMITNVLDPSIRLLQGPSSIPSPGRDKSHYAPDKPMFIVDSQDINEKMTFLSSRYKVIGFGYSKLKFKNWHTLSIDSRIYASQLYNMLHRANKSSADVIVCQKPPNSENWLAIMDRLNKAATNQEMVSS